MGVLKSSKNTDENTVGCFAVSSVCEVPLQSFFLVFIEIVEWMVALRHTQNPLEIFYNTSGLVHFERVFILELY